MLRDVIASVRDKSSLELHEKDKEIAQLKKYEAMAKVKSVNELGIVSPEDTLKLMNEVKENHTEMIKSFGEYLFSGKTDEKLLNQIERLNMLRKSFLDGNFAILEIATKSDDILKDLGIKISNPIDSVLGQYIPTAIYNSEHGNYILNQKIENQVIENAKSLIKSVAGELEEYRLVDIEEGLKKDTNFMKDFYLYFDKGVKSSAEYHNVEPKLNTQNFRSSYLVRREQIGNNKFDETPISYVIGWGKRI